MYYNVLKHNEGDRFNRYMVECKLFSRRISGNAIMRFNRYMVECKSVLSIIDTTVLTVLIDTWWNVNKFL